MPGPVQFSPTLDSMSTSRLECDETDLVKASIGRPAGRSGWFLFQLSFFLSSFQIESKLHKESQQNKETPDLNTNTLAIFGLKLCEKALKKSIIHAALQNFPPLLQWRLQRLEQRIFGIVESCRTTFLLFFFKSELACFFGKRQQLLKILQNNLINACFIYLKRTLNEKLD